MVEQEDADARLRERARYEVVVLAERVETQLQRESRLVVRRALRVISPARLVGTELTDGFQMHGLRVVEEAFLAQPRLGDHPTPFRTGGDEVELMSRRDELFQH